MSLCGIEGIVLTSAGALGAFLAKDLELFAGENGTPVCIGEGLGVVGDGEFGRGVGGVHCESGGVVRKKRVGKGGGKWRGVVGSRGGVVRGNW